MEGNRYSLGDFSMVFEPGWLDITDSLDIDPKPVTLARADGSGALQFSTAVYAGGVLPKITAYALHRLLTDRVAREVNPPPDVSVEQLSDLMIAKAMLVVGGTFWTYWYASDGVSVCFASYNAASGTQGNEPEQCDRMVRTIELSRPG